MLDELEAQLKQIVGALRVLENGEGDSEKNASQSVDIQKSLLELKELLEEDDSDAVDYLEELASHLPMQFVRKMKQALEGYDFEEALEALEQYLEA